jgi:hypothetical protein
MKKINPFGYGMAIGAGIGSAIGVALTNIAIGIAIGIGSGILFSMAMKNRLNKKDEEGKLD